MGLNLLGGADVLVHRCWVRVKKGKWEGKRGLRVVALHLWAQTLRASDHYSSVSKLQASELVPERDSKSKLLV
jgi:hypothetical protein